ncbi:MAG: DUF2341 domain-containing protein, partial [Candidatus Thorarchaeota archaeon]
MNRGFRINITVFILMFIWCVPIFVNGNEIEPDPVLISLDIPLTEGYSIDGDREDIVSTNIQGLLSLTLHESGYVDVDVSFRDGREVATVSTLNIPLTKKTYSYSDGYQSTRLDITSIEDLFFGELHPFENGSIYIVISSITSKGLYTGTAMIHPKDITGEDRDALISTHYTTSVTQIDADELPVEYEKEVRRSKVPTAGRLTDMGEGGRSSGSKIFLLAHYDSNLYNFWDGYREYQNYTVLENSYCTDFLEQADPTVSELRAKLIYCCRQDYLHRLGLYHIGFHGSFFHPSWLDPEDWYSQFGVNGGFVTPTNISDCWNVQNVLPDGAIVCAMSCLSLRDKYYEEVNSTYNLDTMCEAFLDVEYIGSQLGAASYIGCIPNLGGGPGHDLYNPKWRRNGPSAMLFECLARCDMSINESTKFVCDRGIIPQSSDEFTYRIREDLSDPIYLANSDSTEPDYPDDWRFYKTHTIEAAAGAGENYQVNIRVHYDSGEDSGDDVYMQNGDGVPHCQVDFDDIRFEWKNSSNEWESIDYWIDEMVVTDDSHYVDFWVEVRGNLNTTDQEIRLLYGDVGANAANSTSNGTATFPLYDEFNGSSVDADIWNIHSGTSPTVSDGLLQITGSEDGDVLTSEWYDSGGDYEYIVYTKMDKNVASGYWGAFWLRDQCYDPYQYSKGYMFTFYKEANDTSGLYEVDGTILDELDTGSTIDDDEWTIIELYSSQSGSITYIGARDLYLNEYLTDAAYTNGSFGIGKGSGSNLYVDWILARKYLASPPAHGSWGPEYPFMEDWAHRKAHVIKGSEGAGEDYSVRLLVHRYSNDATHQDSGEHVYVGEDINTDFSDIRFLDELSHITMKPHFLRRWCGAIWTEGTAGDDEHLCAEFWVTLDDTLDHDQTVYIYYGNRMATSDNQPVSMFEFFDDFLKEDLDDQWIFEAGSYSIEDGVLEMEDNTTKIYSDDTFMPGVSYHARVYFDDYRSSGFVQQQYGSPRFDSDLATWATQPSAQVDVEDNGNEDKVSVTQPGNEWLSHSINWYSDEYAESFIDGVRKSTHDTYVPDGSSAFGTGIPIYLYTYIGNTNPLLKVDYIIVRKCIYPEPSHGVWGDEVDLDTSPGTWKYRQSHKLIGNTNVGTDYQVKFIAHAGFGSSSGNNVYLNNHSDSDFSDVRFANDDATELLDYWCEYQDATSAEFWVEVSDDLSSNQTIYVYYGFDGAISSSDGHATFDWFEDFEDESLNSNPDSTHWDDPVDDDGGGTYVDVVSDPDSNEDDQALKIYNNGDATQTYVRTKSMSLSSRSYAIGWKWYRDLSEYCYFYIYGNTSRVLDSYTGYFQGVYNDFKFRDMNLVWQQPDPDWVEGEFDFWSRIEIQFTDGLTATLNDNSNGTTHSV